MNGTTHKIGGAIMSLTVSLQTGIYKPSMSMDAGVVPMIQELSLFGILNFLSLMINNYCSLRFAFSI